MFAMEGQQWAKHSSSVVRWQVLDLQVEKVKRNLFRGEDIFDNSGSGTAHML